ncbi:hypothetical protein [Bacillus methanolicus]|uniref:hypothetical protein n=1 Tax=Bacillus methanolicus TaxID=1471 RepID=UPI00200D228D|nr:hypothetical protein [Bacillus methanolicus]
MIEKLIEYLEDRKKTVTGLLASVKTDKDKQTCEIAIKIYDSIIQDIREGKLEMEAGY